MTPTGPLLAVEDLDIAYRRGRAWTPTVHGAAFELAAGETLAIVGQSGSGKSTIANAVLGLLPRARVDGRVRFDGRDLLGIRPRALREVRARDLGYVPQDPAHALNPVRTIGSQLLEALAVASGGTGRRPARADAVALLDRVGIPGAERVLGLHPHELSGGMLQRVLIGAAIAGDRRCIVADEPTSALDVTVQRTILDLLATLQAETGASLLLITHDLSIARERADRVLVLDGGRVQECGAAADVIDRPAAAYTRQLLADVPAMRPDRYAAQKSASRLDPADAVLRLEGVHRRFGDGADAVQALDDVSLAVVRGSTHALVGESGSGKSTLARILLGLERAVRGAVRVDGVDYAGAGRRELAELRRRVQFVYQNPFTSLDPSLSVASIVTEPLRRARIGDRGSRRETAADLLDAVGLEPQHLGVRPGALSGGQRQRVAIARALALDPEVLVLDEPTSALDVSVQARILDLLMAIQYERGLSLLFISHDLGVVRQIADEVTVLRRGVVVEQGTVEAVFGAPRHAYTRDLISAIPGRRAQPVAASSLR